MNDTRTLTSAFSAFLFAALFLLGGCAGNLTGPEADATPDKPVYQVDGQQGQEADRNGDDGSTDTGASHNTSSE